MVAISSYGSGEGPGWETGPGYSTGGEGFSRRVREESLNEALPGALPPIRIRQRRAS
jgi:hypothetical protein